MSVRAVMRPLGVGLMASALSVGGLAGGASAAGLGSAAIPALAAGVADDRGDHLVRVHDRKRHHRHKHRQHHSRHYHGHHNQVVIVEQHHHAPVYRERVVEHYHYVEPRRPYLVDLLTGGAVFIFSFD